MIDDVQSRLTDCHSTVKHLQEENRQLRRACTAFGQLAERLNVELARVRATIDQAVVESRDLHKSVENIERTHEMRQLEDPSDA
jgi:predicted RNase H-like nuclease (RuvC/YqgF family)